MFDRCERRRLRLIWSVAFAITAVLGYGMTPWAVIGSLLETRGVDGGGAALLAAAAGYTLPVSAGVALSLVLIDRGWYPVNGYGRLSLFTGIFLLTTALAEGLGGDLAPADPSLPEAGNMFAVIGSHLLSTYLNTYGWGLLVSAVSIGVATAASVGVWWRDHTRPREEQPRRS